MRKTDLAVAVFLIAGVAAFWQQGAPGPSGPAGKDFNFNLAPPQDLNDTSFAKLAALRQEGFERQPEMSRLIPPAYHFEERPVWSRVDPRVGWSGGAPDATAESFSLLNPFIPCYLEPEIRPGESAALIEITKWRISHYPIFARWQSGPQVLEVHMEHTQDQPKFDKPEGFIYTMNLTNARDLGFEKYTISQENSHGIAADFASIHPLEQEYEPVVVGDSLIKYNELAPRERKDTLEIRSLPARVVINFFRKLAPGVDPTNPDLREIIEIDSRPTTR